mmetsp:Transcript_31903/g.90615  ORF Transcript_31903/g.90615 Transcript_31903/m.90615 type:complete len:262 (+) Transcript_31903:2418-3203(+)
MDSGLHFAGLPLCTSFGLRELLQKAAYLLVPLVRLLRSGACLLCCQRLLRSVSPCKLPIIVVFVRLLLFLLLRLPFLLLVPRLLRLSSTILLPQCSTLNHHHRCNPHPNPFFGRDPSSGWSHRQFLLLLGLLLSRGNMGGHGVAWFLSSNSSNANTAVTSHRILLWSSISGSSDGSALYRQGLGLSLRKQGVSLQPKARLRRETPGLCQRGLYRQLPAGGHITHLRGHWPGRCHGLLGRWVSGLLFRKVASCSGLLHRAVP